MATEEKGSRMKEYYYGMRLRGFSPGCQPMDGLKRAEDGKGKYHSILVYDRVLSEKELRDYELDYIDCENRCCATCTKHLELQIWDYKQKDVPKVEMPGYVCTLFAPDGFCSYMVGCDAETGLCECYKKREKKGENNLHENHENT